MATAQRFRRAVALTAAMVAALAMALPVAPAAADPPPPEIRFVSGIVVVNRLRPDTATVYGNYRCFGGEPIHLWVSAKQGGPDPTAEGSGATSTAWYDTNIIDPPPVNCDGRWHTTRVTVGRHPDKARLSNGDAWVQFCLVAPGEGFGIVASNSRWVRVIGAS